MTNQLERNYLGETLPVRLPDGQSVKATVCYNDDTDLRRLLVVFPPNPILGGDSENNVVQAMLAEGVARGVLAATFDYRGVADGHIDGTDIMSYWEELEAKGSYGIIDDDATVSVQTVQRAFGAGPCCALVGYSFGCYLALRTAPALGAFCVAGVSPPLTEYDLVPWLGDLAVHFFVAPRDVFCPAAQAQALFSGHNATVETFDSDDHFFRGTEHVLAKRVLDAVGISEGRR